MFALYGKIPCFIGFVLVKGEPSCNNFKLFSRQRTCQQFTVDCNNGFVFSIVDMNMRLMMLSNILEEHIYNHPAKAAKFRHKHTYIPNFQ